jgi:hypothetical protein
MSSSTSRAALVEFAPATGRPVTSSMIFLMTGVAAFLPAGCGYGNVGSKIPGFSPSCILYNYNNNDYCPS